MGKSLEQKATEFLAEHGYDADGRPLSEDAPKEVRLVFQPTPGRSTKARTMKTPPKRG
jgi:hypothetical protein